MPAEIFKYDISLCPYWLIHWLVWWDTGLNLTLVCWCIQAYDTENFEVNNASVQVMAFMDSSKLIF